MKRRITAATLAAATALSLTVAPAASATTGYSDGYQKDSSSQVTDAETGLYVLGAVFLEAVDPGAGFSPFFKGSSEAGLYDIGEQTTQEDINRITLSSFRNDANNGYKLGTTWDILVGTGIALSLLAALGGFALSQGLIKF